MIQKKTPIPHKDSARRRRKILITGASGYVGATLAAALKDEYEVVGFGYGAEIEGDVADYKALSRAAKGACAIIHTASPTTDAWCREHPYDALRTIVHGTRNVCRAAEEHKVPLVVHFSTQAVYSNFAKRPLPHREDMELQPDTFYGALKALAEKELMRNERGINAERTRKMDEVKTEVVILRPANIYGIGAGVLRRNVFSVFAENARNGKPLVIYGDGKQKADFVHVRDIARLVAFILKRQETPHQNKFGTGQASDPKYQSRARYGAGKGQVVINAGSGKPTAIKDIARLVSAEMKRQGKKVTITSNPVAKDTLAADRWLSVAKAKKLYGWKAEISLEQGIHELLI